MILFLLACVSLDADMIRACATACAPSGMREIVGESIDLPARCVCQTLETPE